MVVGVAYMATWALLLWAKTVDLMKVMQVTYGLGTACEISYYSYLYAVVPRDYFAKVASFNRAASLAGKFAAYLSAQLTTSFDLLDYFDLNIFSFVSVGIAFLISLVLPRAKYSELFNPQPDIEINVEVVTDNPNPATNNGAPDAIDDISIAIVETTDAPWYACLKGGIIYLYLEAKLIYFDKTILIWSIWWAFASCGNFQVGNYVQNLWHILTPYQNDGDKRHLYNGAVEAAGTLFSEYTICFEYMRNGSL